MTRQPTEQPVPVHITSRDNPLLKDLRRLAGDNVAYRKLGRVWVEGDHLCGAAVLRGITPDVAVYSESNWQPALVKYGKFAFKNIVVPDRLFRDVSALESPADVGFIIDIPVSQNIDLGARTVILDRVQDTGNVGSILRSAAAFGFTQVLALKGTAALWSSKVLRAGMGAHFGLQLMEELTLADIDGLTVPIYATSSHQGGWIQNQTLAQPCAWVMGHEGQGVSESLQSRAAMMVRIGQPGGEESLNVAAAAAICLHASSIATL